MLIGGRCNLIVTPPPSPPPPTNTSTANGSSTATNTSAGPNTTPSVPLACNSTYQVYFNRSCIDCLQAPDFLSKLNICSTIDADGTVFLDWTYSLATVSPEHTTVTLRLAYPRLQPASSFYQKVLLLGYKSTVFQVKVMTLSTDTVSESDPKEYLNTTLRSEATDTGLKLYFDSFVPPKTVMRL